MPAPMPPMDEHTQYRLADLEQEIARGPGWCHCPDYSPTFLTLAEYRDMLLSREVTAGGGIRCSGWAQSQRRRCAHYSGWPVAYSTSWSECPNHPGIHVPAAIPTWYCEHHSEVTAWTA